MKYKIALYQEKLPDSIALSIASSFRTLNDWTLSPSAPNACSSFPMCCANRAVDLASCSDNSFSVARNSGFIGFSSLAWKNRIFF